MSGARAINLQLIVPVFNEAAAVRGLIRSLSLQTEANFQVVFIDSGSTDSTSQVIRDSIPEGWRLVSFPDNLGVALNWRRALTWSLDNLTFTHFAFLGGDDEVSANYVFSCLRALQSHEIVTPNFISEGRDGEKRQILHADELQAFALFSRWRLCHLCYSVFPKDFASDFFVPILQISGTSFDFWVAHFALLQGCELVSDAMYLKNLKGRAYGDAYYTGASDQGKKEENGLSSPAAFLLPLREAVNLFWMSKELKNSGLPLTPSRILVTATLGRYKEAVSLHLSNITKRRLANGGFRRH